MVKDMTIRWSIVAEHLGGVVGNPFQISDRTVSCMRPIFIWSSLIFVIGTLYICRSSPPISSPPTSLIRYSFRIVIICTFSNRENKHKELKCRWTVYFYDEKISAAKGVNEIEKKSKSHYYDRKFRNEFRNAQAFIGCWSLRRTLVTTF